MKENTKKEKKPLTIGQILAIIFGGIAANTVGFILVGYLFVFAIASLFTNAIGYKRNFVTKCEFATANNSLVIDFGDDYGVGTGSLKLGDTSYDINGYFVGERYAHFLIEEQGEDEENNPCIMVCQSQCDYDYKTITLAFEFDDIGSDYQSYFTEGQTYQYTLFKK